MRVVCDGGGCKTAWRLRRDCVRPPCLASQRHMAVVSPMKLRCIGHDDVTTSGNEPPRCHTHDHRHWPQVELRILAIPCSSWAQWSLANMQGTQRITTVSPEVKVAKKNPPLRAEKYFKAARLGCGSPALPGP